MRKYVNCQHVGALYSSNVMKYLEQERQYFISRHYTTLNKEIYLFISCNPTTNVVADKMSTTPEG